MVRDIYPFTYPIRPNGNQPAQPHLLRDLAALHQHTAGLLPSGDYVLRDTINNFPGRRTTVDLGQLEDALILIPTRLPQDDETLGGRRRIKRSWSNLEEEILDHVRTRYFDELHRGCVELSDALAAKLPSQDAHLAKIGFVTQGSARYSFVKPKGRVPARELKDCPCTAAYLFRTPPLWAYGPEVLAIFAMTGSVTHIWSLLIRDRYPDLITSPKHRFVMAELEYGAMPYEPPDNSFASTWGSRVVMDVDLPL